METDPIGRCHLEEPGDAGDAERRADGGPLTRTRVRAAVAVVVVALLVVGVPELLAALTRPSGVPVERPVPVAFHGGRLAIPAGWVLTQVPVQPHRPSTWTRGDATLSVQTEPLADVAVFADRQVRRLRVAGDTVVPDGSVRTPSGLTGPAFVVTAPDGRRGRLVVVGVGTAEVSVFASAREDQPAALAGLRDVVTSLVTA